VAGAPIAAGAPLQGGEGAIVIVVLGRPRVYRPEPDGQLVPGGLAAEVALALGRAGVPVELVGSIGDDPEGDRVVVELGREGVGHAALLRDPAVRTPPLASTGESAVVLPHLEAADVALGLRYLPECRVLVVAEDLAPAAREQALDSAGYHGAAVIIVASAGSLDPASLGDGVTLLERRAPWVRHEAEESDAVAAARARAVDDAVFAGLIAEYARRLAEGEAPERAFTAALAGGAWEPSPG
jgi:hypothetical protein